MSRTVTAPGTGVVVAVALSVSLAMFALLAYVHFRSDVRVYQLLDDTSSYAGVKWYTGSVSYLVVLLWCATAAICGFSGWLLRELGEAGGRGLVQFLFVFCAANIWLTLDDLFLVHEQAARQIGGRESQHLAEGAIFAIYAVILAIAFWRFRTTIAQTEFLLLGGAVLCLLASAAVDVAFQLELDGNNLFREMVLSRSWGPPMTDVFEEILKLLGAILWLCYFSLTGLLGIRGVFARGVRTAS